jgi:hypothetical protein
MTKNHHSLEKKGKGPSPDGIAEERGLVKGLSGGEKIFY